MNKILNKLKTFFKSSSTDNLYKSDGCVPLSKAIPFGLQHVLAMFVGNITPILIVSGIATLHGDFDTANAIRSAIFIAGLGTIIQLFPIWRIGSKLPIVVGVSFTFLGTVAMITSNYGFGVTLGSMMIGGLVIAVLGLFAKYWRRFIKPIVAAIVVLGIGLSLLAVGAQQFIGYSSGTIVKETVNGVVNSYYDFSIGWKFILVSVITLFTSILYQCIVKGVWKNLNIIVSILVGYCVSLIIHFTTGESFMNFSPLLEPFKDGINVTDFIDIPRFTDFTKIEFKIGPIISIVLIYIVAATEGIGDISALASTGLNREATEKEISGGLVADGLISTVSAMFGCLPLTTFSQNVGLVAQTKIVNRFTILMGAIFLILASLFPPIANLIQTIPEPVLGGCMIVLFASIIVSGMKMLGQVGYSSKNILILCVSLGLGFGITLIGEFIAGFKGEIGLNLQQVFSNPVANMFLISLIFSYIVPESINRDDDTQPSNAQ